MNWILASNLDFWASSRDCQEHLPLVIRRLIKATSTEISNIAFPAGDSIVYSGWDGILEVITGNEYMPKGLSVWELGANENIKKKANGDYQKRKENSLGIDSKEATFIFVTPRIWRDKDIWAKEKKDESFWKDVRVYDARILEEWIEQAPVVGAWLAQYLKIYPEGVESLEDWWNEWSSVTNPQITSKLIIAGRGNQVSEIKQWLNSSPALKAVQATTNDEGLAFLAAIINLLPEQERDYWFSKSLIVKNYESFRSINITNRFSLLLIPQFEKIEETSLATQKGGHRIYISLSPQNKRIIEKVVLPRLGREEFVSAITEMGLSKEDAEKYSKDTGRSLTVLRRRLATHPNQPEWSKAEFARDMIPLLLLESWNETKEADKAIISELAGESYDSFLKKLSILLNKPDSPILKIGEFWRLLSPFDAFFEIASYLTEADFKQLKGIIFKVCGSLDPGLELEPDKRWMASVYGKVPSFSESLKEGLAQTLILIAVFGENAKISIPTTCQTWVDNVVKELLQDADWKLWNSISDILPLIAEASPSSFLNAVDFSLAKDNPSIMDLFSEAKGFLGSSSNHSDLLWALEGLAWDPLLLSRVTLILGKLARLDPGGSLANRPSNSLRTIFLFWLPQTFASLKERFEAIDTLIKWEPQVGWELLMALMPRNHDSSFPNHKTRWREFSDRIEKRVTLDERIKSIKELVKRILSNVNYNGWRWSKVLENYSNLPLGERDGISKYLTSIIDKISDDKSELRNVLRRILSHHRAYYDSDWALPEQELEKLESIYLSLEPEDTIERLCWLFNEQWPDLPEGEKRDYKKSEKTIQGNRTEAIKTIKGQQGINGLIELAKQTTYPAIVGRVVAEIDLNIEEEKILFPLLEDEGKNEILFIQNYIYSQALKKKDKWIRKLIEMAESQKWPDKKIINLFISFPQNKLVWDILEHFNKNIRESYWKKCYINLYNATTEEKIYAIKKLINVTRYFSALDTTALYIKEVPLELIIEVLNKTATENCEENVSILQSYDIEKLFGVLDKSDELKEEEMAKLEWMYLSFLARVGSGRPPRTLHKELTNNPNFFSEVIKFIYKPKNEDKIEENESQPLELLKQRAQLARELLESWHTVPGSESSGKINYDLLKIWVEKARALCKEIDRAEIGDDHIGKILAYSKSNDEEMWPPEPVCKIIDELQSKELEEGFIIEVHNKRGPTSRSPFEGGQQERVLAESFKKNAHKLSIRYPRTAAILTDIANYYENEAKRHDKEAEKRELEY